jgi:hypothetical protein
VNALTHVSHTFINFDNGSFQWIDVQRFRFTDALEPSHPDLLTAVIAHEVFGNDYATRPGNNPERHGPYWRDRITPASYYPMAPAAAEQELRTWTEQFVPLAPETRLQVEQQVVEPLRATDAVYRLRDLGPDALHDWRGVHNEFHEFVLLKTPAR